MSVLSLGPELTLPLEDVVGQCVAILGIRGSGKSNTAGVIFEELLQAHYPMSLVDIDGEYFGLKEKYEVLVVGGGDHADVELNMAAAGEVADLSLHEGVPVILDVSDMLSEERERFVFDYLTRVWSLAGRLRTPYMIGIEECHEFIPQGVRTPLKDVIARIALRGRKRGLGAVVISQRSAKVEKDVLTQAGMLFLHRVVHEADMRVYGELLPWRKLEAKETVSQLGVGECIFMSGSAARKVKIRVRHTFHGGYTPSFRPVESPKLRQVRGRILEALARARDVAPSLVETDPSPSCGAPAFASAASTAQPAWEEHRNAAPCSPVALVEEDVLDGEPDLPEPVLLRVDRLLRRLRRLPPVQQRLVGFLVGQEPSAYTTDELAAWVDCPEALLRVEPPVAALDMGLVACERLARGVTYRGMVRQYVDEAFSGFASGLGSEGTRRLIAYLRRRIAGLSPAERDLAHIP
ncbi:MAG: ATP-binding protein [Candidatus Bipolaricaulota bacterium]